MTSHIWTRALLALALGAAGSSHAALAVEFRCRNGDQERRIELSGPGAAEGRACEVRYWRDATVEGSGRVLWYARQDADFCASKADELVARLEAGGWTCTAAEPAAAAQPEATEEAAVPPADAPAPTPPAPEPQETTAPAPAAPEPAPEPAPQPAARGLPAAPAPQHAELAAIAPAAPPPSAPTRREAAPAEPIVPLAAHPSAALLDEVVQETLRSVEDLYGGAFEAEHAAFGDLDGDGAADAAVLITYRPERDEYVQYLVAYLFNGETFQSVATRNVSGRFLDALRADLEGITDRRIMVALEMPDEGAACCATRRAAFALQGGQLVEEADPDGTEVEKTSQTERSSPG